MTTQEQLKKLESLEEIARLMLDQSVQLRQDIEKTLNKPPAKRKKKPPVIPADVMAKIRAKHQRRYGQGSPTS